MPRHGNTSRSDVSLDKTPHRNTTKLHAGRVNRRSSAPRRTWTRAQTREREPDMLHVAHWGNNC
eukprot:1358115-Prymnesium_polylepis.1